MWGQKSVPCSVVATLKSENNAKIEFMNVLILSSKDSSLIKGDAFFDEKIRISGVEQTQFLVAFQAMSFAKTIIPVNRNSTDTLVNLGEITLSTSATLNEVVVRSSVPQFEYAEAKTIVNVESTPLSSSGTAIDVLRKSAKVVVDKDDNVSVFGKGKTKIYIDGREASADEIKDIGSENIAKIIIDSNPGAKYDADVSAVILIKTKRNRIGYNIRNTTYVTKGTYWRLYESFNFSFKYKRFGGKFEYITNLANVKVTNEYYRVFDYQTYKTYMTNEVERSRNYKFPKIFTIETSYDLTLSSYIGVRYSAQLRDFKDESNNINVVEKLGSITNYKTQTDANYNMNNHFFTLNYNNELDTLGHSISTQFDYSIFNTDNVENISEQIERSTSTLAYLRKNNNNREYKMGSAVVDYVKPLGNSGFAIEAGVKYVNIESNDVTDFQMKLNDTWERVNDLSQTFKYNENLLAGYSLVRKKMNKLSLSAGVRYEIWKMSGTTTLDENGFPDRKYNDFFPNFNATYHFSKLLKTSLSYSKKVSRPSFQDLSTERNYIDSVTYFEGNPNLVPQKEDAFNWTVSFMELASLSLDYTHTEKPLSLYIKEVKGIVAAVNENLDNSDQFAVTLNLPYQMGIWTTYNSFSFSYTKMNYEKGGGYTLNTEKPFFYFFTYHSFDLPKHFNIYVNYLYHTSGQEGIFSFDPKYTVSAGISKTFFDKKIKTQLLFNDIFDTQRDNGDTRLAHMYVKYKTFYDASFVRFILTFNIGKETKTKAIKSGMEDEMKRVKQD